MLRLLILVTFLTIGCSTLHDKAQKHLTNESYDQAIGVYQDILRYDPKDRGALAGLTKARVGWIGKKLIQVRLLRLAGNHRKSLDLLLSIYSNENAWGVFPTGAAAFTQEEESHFAQKSIKFVVLKSLKKNKPLKAQFYLEKYDM
ncbi:hypothetical protein N9W41_01450, partial [bacterium]|nr:hypothetical protein [bacterium]